MGRNSISRNLVTLLLMLSGATSLGQVHQSEDGTRIKDLVNLKGVRPNQLIGFGLVVGLSATGDSSANLATNEAAKQLLRRVGMPNAGTQAATSNVAAVLATAELPPFAKIGDKIDIKVSTIGDATSLAGGTLILTPLRAGDHQVYVMGQGSVVVGQASGQGAQVLTVARVPKGGMIEREFLPQLATDGYLNISLKTADFTTNSRVAEAINRHFRGFFAKSVDPATIRIEIPAQYHDALIDFVTEFERLRVDVDRKARIVLNERTGTIILGADVTITDIAIAHGSLSIRIGQGGEEEENATGAIATVKKATVGGLIETLNAMGVQTTDLVGVLQALHTAGALQADLEFM